MKKFLNAWGVSVVLICTLSLLASCKKEDPKPTSTPEPAVVKIVDFTVSKTVALQGQSVTATWSTQNAATAALNGSSVPTIGSTSISGLTGDTNLKLTATADKSTDQREIKISVADSLASWLATGVWVPDSCFAKTPTYNGGNWFYFPFTSCKMDDEFTFTVTAASSVDGIASGSVLQTMGSNRCEPTVSSQSSSWNIATPGKTFSMFYEDYSIISISSTTLKILTPSTNIVLGGGGVYSGFLLKTYKKK